MKVGIFIADSNGAYPVPATRGGAVQSLVESLVKLNNEKKLIDMDVISFYDDEAEKISKYYPNINFIWINPPRIVKKFDKLFFDVIQKKLKKKKAISYKSIFSLLYYIKEATKLLIDNKYEKVVFENNVPLVWAIKLSNYRGEIYYHFHNVPRIDAKSRDVFKRVTRFICVSRYVGEQICSKESAIGQVDREKVKILYNCIDTKKFFVQKCSEEKNNVRSKYGLKPDDIVVLFVGRISEEKGIDKLLEAVQLLNNEKIKVLVVGSYLHNEKGTDKFQTKIYNMAKKMKGRVKVTGYIQQEKIPEIYRCADIAVLPSMWEEPAGLTVVEAMACGLPVITTISGGIPEYAGSCCKILERDNNLVLNISKEINNLINNNEYSLIDLSEKRVKSEFNLDNYLEKFCACIGVCTN